MKFLLLLLILLEIVMFSYKNILIYCNDIILKILAQFPALEVGNQLFIYFYVFTFSVF